MISFLINAFKIIFLLGFLIFIHEGGHFLTAKLCKVKVKEFAIGFGPTIWKKQGKETIYALRLIPLGGFVNLEGESEPSEDEKSFSKASITKRILIVAAGAIVNIVFAVIIYFLISATDTIHVSTKVDKLLPGYAAEAAGLMENDEIIKVDNKKVRISSDISRILQYNNGKEINLLIKRGDEKINISLVPTEVPYEYNGTKVSLYYIGVQFKTIDPGFKNNVYYAWLDTVNFLKAIFDNLKQLITGNVSGADLVGPIGISSIVSKTSNVTEFIYLLATISMSLGVTNLLPFPPLDGGKILFLLIEAIRKKRIKEEIEIKIQMWGFAILIALSIYVAYHDILRIR